ncbi:MAG: endonuclease IV [Syntrophorhabdaceae bacterium PtaU1.Bin034]|jgi:sugar phosphate isomerase/epimerase|nr:MAG: endonuclease IV [Syntrophorhabdaceae bacterium PtaU1.Bin034]
MKILFSTGSLFYLPLKEIFLIARDAGFDGCDLVVQSHLDDPYYKETLHECIQILPVFAMHTPFLRLTSWGNQIEALIKCIEVAKEFGIGVVNFHPPSWFSMEIGFLKWFRGIKDFQRELRCEPVFLALENMPLLAKSTKINTYVLNTIDEIIRFGSQRNLYFTLDTTHAATTGHDIIPTFLNLYKTGRLMHVHLSDYSRIGSHLFPGSGSLPIVKLLNTMRKMGYNQAISLEVSPMQLPSAALPLKKVLWYAASFLKMHAGNELQEGEERG